MKHSFKTSALLLLTLGFTWFSACDKIRETKETISSAEDFANSESEFTAAFDVSDDLNSTDFKLRSSSAGILPSGAVFTWIDSSFSDGNGVVYEIDFGPLGTAAPFGRECNDGKFRAGVFRFSLDKRYTEIGATGILTIADSNNYYSGDGLVMTKLSGALSITRTAVNKLTVEVRNGKAERNNKTWLFYGTRFIENTKPGGPGIIGDEFTINGSGGGTNKDGVNYTWLVKEDLIKNIEKGCANTFVKGVLEIVNDNGGYISVDFDPKKDGACDRLARATINGKTFDFMVR